MRASSALICSLLRLCIVVHGSPSPNERLTSRLARRAAGIGRTHTNAVRTSDERSVPGSEITADANVEYRDTWCGIVISKTAATWRSVTGTIVLPTPKAPSGGTASSPYSASASVGIDGDTCGNAILETGIDFDVTGSAISYVAWYEWYPDYSYDFSGITFAPGNTVNMTLLLTSPRAGTATISNLSTGQTVSHSFIAESSPLCEYDVEWLVGTGSGGSGALADFGTVEWTNMCATTRANPGICVDPSEKGSGGVVLELERDGKVLGEVATTTSGMTVSYV